MKYSVDRIENGVAVCEDENGNFEKFSVTILPEKICEGDIFTAADGVFTILADETAARKKKIADLQKGIFTRKKK